MIDKDQIDKISKNLPFLQHADAQLMRELEQSAFMTWILTGHDVFVESDLVDAIALLISGVVRASTIGKTGREITLLKGLYKAFSVKPPQIVDAPKFIVAIR